MQKSLDTAKDITQLEIKSNQQRKTDFLKPLITSLIFVQSLAFIIMLTPPVSQGDWFAIMGLGFFLSLVALFLTQRGYAQLAAHLFCHNVNFLIFIMFLINLIIERDVELTILFGCILALSVLLAGMLISPRATFGFVALNTGLIFISYFVTNDVSELALRNALRNSFPIIGFFFLVAIVSWLYQRTLNRANDRLSEAHQQLTQTKVMQRDMQIARDLQQRLYPAPPHIGPHLAVAARSEPARETSGDFYDFIDLGPHKCGIVVADVTGKSLAAALIMAMARSTLRSEARRNTSPATVLRQANQTLHEDASVDQMITTFYGILDTNKPSFEYSNAGHIFPVLKRNKHIGNLELLGWPLKAMPNAHYQEAILQLLPGDQIILVTDGIIEAMNAHKELFGFDRLAETIYGLNTADPQETLEAIWQAVETFCGEVEPEDDRTIVVISVKDKENTHD